MLPGLMALPGPLAHLSIGPVFIVGHHRSGTTWVFDILTAHPAVAGAYESFLFTEPYGLGALFRGMRSGADGPTHAARSLIDRDEHVADVRELAAQWLGRVVKPHHRVVVEKSPSHLSAGNLISEVFPEARFICVERDGRDVAVSVRAAAKSWAPGWRRRFGLTLALAARGWQEAIDVAAEWRTSTPDAFMTVRFEDIQTEPRREYRRMFDFCSLDYDDEFLDSVFDATDFTRNFEGGDDNFRRSGRAGDWRKHLGVVDSLVFAAMGGEGLVRAGYEPHPWRWALRRTR
jgi:hypothetical protein